MAEELGSIFEIQDSFERGKKVFEKFTGNKLSTPTIQSQVEKIGIEISEKIKEQSKEAEKVILPAQGILNKYTKNNSENKEILYVGVDGTGVPMKGGGTKEAKVGIVFKEKDIWRLSEKRKEIVNKAYIATMEDVNIFFSLFWWLYLQIAGFTNYKIICLGDGAPWIWKRFAELFPERIEILDFFHLSEYVWKVGKECFGEGLKRTEKWVEKQLDRLKESKSELLLSELKFLKKSYKDKDSSESIKKLESYLKSNATRIDYKNYLEKGYMIGSGVVESSNKVVITKRMKQGGMHWSMKGAQAIGSLRAVYCSDNNEWEDYWNQRIA
jgi:hypothetical protein